MKGFFQKGSFKIEANSLRKEGLYGSCYKKKRTRGKKIFIWSSSIVLLLVICTAIFEHIYAEICAKDRWNDKTRGFTTCCYGKAR